MKAVSGNNQQGDNTEFLKDCVVFIVTGRNQNPVPGKPVDFHIVSGGGTLDDNQRITDPEGMVYIKWKVGTGMDQIFKASVEDDNGITDESWVISNSDVELTTNWISGVNFYSNFTEPLQHDNKILETDHFLIFSDAATDDNKVIFAKIAEEHFYNILAWFEIEYQELGIDKRDRDTKIKICAHTNTTTPGIWRGEENYGILIQALYYSVKQDNPSSFTGEGLPVETVSWNEEERSVMATNRRRSHPASFKIDDLGFRIARNRR